MSEESNESLCRIVAARRLVAERDLELAEATVNRKVAKDAYDDAIGNLLMVISEETAEMPLFDRPEAEGGAA